MSISGQYLPIMLFLIIAVGLAVIMVTLPFLVGSKGADKETLSPYECGFEPFSEARAPFDVKFYLVSILFIIFDLEIAFLFPWATALGEIGVFGYWSMFIFLTLLLIGFIYEWRRGALNW